ncbi:MAG: GPW/gp25 family protein [Kiritimatiellales bacterium]
MNGMDKRTGKRLSGLDHLRQSVEDILRTPVGSLVMMRDYGSELFSLIDAPQTVANRARMIAATAGALKKWEPRLQTTHVEISNVGGGGNTEPVHHASVLVVVTGYYTPTGEPVVLDGIKIQ